MSKCDFFETGISRPSRELTFEKAGKTDEVTRQTCDWTQLHQPVYFARADTNSLYPLEKVTKSSLRSQPSDGAEGRPTPGGPSGLARQMSCALCSTLAQHPPPGKRASLERSRIAPAIAIISFSDAIYR